MNAGFLTLLMILNSNLVRKNRIFSEFVAKKYHTKLSFELAIY